MMAEIPFRSGKEANAKPSHVTRHFVLFTVAFLKILKQETTFQLIEFPVNIGVPESLFHQPCSCGFHALGYF